MILSFKCKKTQILFEKHQVHKDFRAFAKQSLKKLEMINASSKLDDLRIPPANRLEALKGDRKGQFSIRINDQWRICFKWEGHNAYEVEIVDYH